MEVTGRGRKTALSLSPGRLAPRSSAFDLRQGEGVRKSLVAEFRAGGKPLFVIANHWTSKWDDERAFGAHQPPTTPTAAKREAQGKVVRGFVDQLLERNRDARVVVLGDLNEALPFAGVAALSAPPMANLALGLDLGDRYSFNFEGSSDLLDHIVVSPSLAKGAELDIVHVNSNCPDSVRTSDHDPVVARVRL